MRRAAARRETNQKPTLCRSLSCFLPGFPRPAISFRECMDEKGRGVAAPFREMAALFLVALVALVALAAFAAFVFGGRRGFRRLLLDAGNVGCGRHGRGRREGSLDRGDPGS